MAVIKKTDAKKMTKEQMEKKLTEIELAMLELRGQGKHEKIKPLKKAIASLKTRIHALGNSKA